MSIDYEDLRYKILDRFDVHDLVDILEINELDILDEFRARVIDNYDKLLDFLDYHEEGEQEEIEL